MPSLFALNALKSVITGAEYDCTVNVEDAVAVLPLESVTVVATVIVPLDVSAPDVKLFAVEELIVVEPALTVVDLDVIVPLNLLAAVRVTVTVDRPCT